MLDGTPTRTVNYMKQPGEFERCESTLLSGWHRFNYIAQISTTPVVAGQCGSSAPIYLQGMKINGSLVYGVQCHFQQYFSYIVTVSFIDGGNQINRRKTPTCWYIYCSKHKQYKDTHFGDTLVQLIIQMTIY
jgi:hypothetical protein